MSDVAQKPKLIGSFIRQRREALGLSQRKLGLLFNPTVTTQFISNVERGVTPLPPAHIPGISKALLVKEEEITALLEREYTLKLSERLGKGEAVASIAPADGENPFPTLVIANRDFDFMRRVYDAYRRADTKTQLAFGTLCESLLGVTIGQKIENKNEEVN